MLNTNQPGFLRTVLLLDAATCVASGLVMSLGAGAIASRTGLPPALLAYAGLALLPIAAFMAWVATRTPVPAPGVWIVILGNAAWIAGCLWLMLGGLGGLTALGHAFVGAQALAVAVLAELEYLGLKRRLAAAG
jgi:hypothetical protein